MSRPTKLLILTVLALPLIACSAEPVVGVHRGHSADELRVTVDQLVTRWVVDGDWRVSPTLAAAGGASRVGVLLAFDVPTEMPSIQARSIVDGRPAGPWVELRSTFSEVDHHVAVVDLDTIADGAQLRLPAVSAEFLSHLRFTATIPEAPLDEEHLGDGLGASRAALRGELAGLGVVSREAWGARRTRCSSRDASKSRLAVHYTVTPSANPERQVRAIQTYHMDSRGWCDVGYHFLVGIDGSVYEGRPLDLRGAHVGGHNTGNVGVSFIGCFHPTGCRSGWGPTHPPEIMVEAGGRLLAQLADMHGITVTSATLKGHRDHSGASTSCPGDHLHARLGDLRAMARGGAAPAPPPDPAPGAAGDSCRHSLGGTYADTACSAGYQCCGGDWRTRGSGCGACLCEETTGRAGCTSAPMSEPAPEPPAPEPPAPVEAPPGASCVHSWGGTYGNTACSASYQCCDGTWGVRGACGACLCVEESGSTGCASGGVPEPAPEPEPVLPPPGASCFHSYGGAYANTACSAGYQCCDGTWRTREACGACFCVEATGTSGCGGTTSSGPRFHAGLSQGGSEVPRAGLSNPTLASTLGLSVEPYGDVVVADGASWVEGRVSWFGGPRDTGIGPTDTGAITGERVRDLNVPEDPGAPTLASRPEDYYWVAMRFSYSPNGRSFWRDARLLLRNPSTGRSIVVRPVDWGPHTRTRRIIDLSPQAISDLGLVTDEQVLIAFASPGAPLGVIE